MNVIFISIDSLSRHWLRIYGQTADIPVETPNLDRFAQRAAIFDTHYAGSLPCMPARRELFAGIQEFLWRPWGPMEPFDTPLAFAARKAGTVTQLVTDHYHLFQHGSHGYFEDYQGFEFIRGHEFDAWKTSRNGVSDVLRAQVLAGKQLEDTFDNGPTTREGYVRNVASFQSEADFFAPKVFARTAEWLRANQDHRKSLLVVDSFDVHEPFHCPQPYASMFTNEDPNDPDLVVWPYYGRTDRGQSQLTPRQVAFVRSQYAGKIAMVDRWFGMVLDLFDELRLWDTTMIVVTTDHGHYLGDHGWMGKPNAPLYNVLAHTPLFIWHPGTPMMGKRIQALTATVDLYATILEALEGDIPRHVHSRSLLPLLRGETDRHRDWALYGYWGSTVNVSDGHYTYLHPCRTDLPVNCYSTGMMNPFGWFAMPEVQREAEAGRFLPYTDSPVWRYPAMSYTRHSEPLLFDVQHDPLQEENLAGQGHPDEARMRDLLVAALRELRAPTEQYERLDLPSAS